MNVLQVFKGSIHGGVSRHVAELAQGLIDRGHDTRHAGQRLNDHDRYAALEPQWIEAPLDGGPAALFRSITTIDRALGSFRPDIIHAHHRKAALVGRRLAKRYRCPLIFTLHLTGIPTSGPRRWLSDLGDRTLAVSAQAKQWLIDEMRLAPGRIDVVPNGYDPAAFPQATAQDRAAARASLNLTPDQPVVAYVGRLEPPKNEAWLADLTAAAHAAGLHAVALIQGSGPGQATLTARAEQLAVPDAVRFVPYGDPRTVYAAADLFALPSAHEGFSLVCLEAMATGTPVLRTRTAGTEEMIVEHTTGRAVPIDRDAFVAAGVEMLADRPALRRMGDAAAQHARTHLTLDRQVDRTLAVYRAAAGEAAP
ncbi:MAG: glycosyltransferase family 4 protein [Planctomycetota bacterium]